MGKHKEDHLEEVDVDWVIILKCVVKLKWILR